MKPVVFIEAKVISPVGVDQLNRHRRTAERFDFSDIIGVVITPLTLATALPTGTVPLEWRSVYAWLRQHASDAASWAQRAADYLEIAEAKMIKSRAEPSEGRPDEAGPLRNPAAGQCAHLRGQAVHSRPWAEVRCRPDARSQAGVRASM